MKIPAMREAERDRQPDADRAHVNSRGEGVHRVGWRKTPIARARVGPLLVLVAPRHFGEIEAILPHQ